MAAHPRTVHRQGTGMDWLTRLFTVRCTPAEERREELVQQTLTLMDDFKQEVRRDIAREQDTLRFPLDSVRVHDDDPG